MARLPKRIMFPIVSTLYVAGIFILPRALPGQFAQRVWNPYSLLHIPLYGVLMILLILSFRPNHTNPKTVSPMSLSYVLPGGIATLVGILDEVNQIYTPGREACFTDVILDAFGIIFAGIIIYFYQQRRNKWMKIGLTKLI